MRSVDELYVVFRESVLVQIEIAHISMMEGGLDYHMAAKVLSEGPLNHVQPHTFDLYVVKAEPTFAAMMNAMTMSFGDASDNPRKMHHYRRSAIRLLMIKQDTSGWYSL